METLRIGMKHSEEWEVTEKLCTTRGEYKVFSTPSMTLFVEMTCHHLVAPHLAPGQGQVGLAIALRHLAPTPLGKKVRAQAELVGMDRRRLSFRVKVYDEIEQVGEAEHERFVIDLDRYLERLKKKLQA
jgi:predicted thioesterase